MAISMPQVAVLHCSNVNKSYELLEKQLKTNLLDWGCSA